MNEPKVSIIIPVYNTEKYLRRCLASVCGQLLSDIEIICINDGSTDNSKNILLEFAKIDNRIKIIDQENKGVGTSRNIGINNSTAAYIGFVDSDDYIAPDMLEKMYNAMVQNDVDFVECGAETYFTYQLDNMNGLRMFYSSKPPYGIVKDPNIIITSSPDPWKILFKKEIINKFSLSFTEGFSVSGDDIFIYSYKIFSSCGYYINENLYMYFCYENSLSGKSRAKNLGIQALERLEIINKYYHFLKKYEIFEKYKDFFWDYFTGRIDAFYNWSSQDIIETYGLKIIREFLQNEDISKLVDEKNKLYHAFTYLNDKELLKLSFLNKNQSKFNLKKIIKYILPYGLVCYKKNKKN